MKKLAVLIYFMVSASLKGFVYEVGPSHEYESIGDVPLENLNPGDTVKIFYRQEPYREKWVIARSGTQDAPIVFKGIPDENGNLPVIDGDSARTRRELDYWSEERAIVNVGGSSTPSDTPRYIIIESLEFVNARPPYIFYDDSGNERAYSNNAAAIDVIYGEHITIRNCIIHNCANGIFTCHAASYIVLEGNYIFDNGMENSIYQHNSYTESYHITFQFNHYGHLRENCYGNNLKDRSAGTVIRYNWIEGGNRQLDLVESNYAALYDTPEYRETFVYGNILYEDSDDGNSQILHYGGDGGDTDYYRKGTLYFYNNTVISKRSGNTTLMNLSTNDEHCDMRNNIVYTTQSGAYLAMLDESGMLIMRNNWLKTGWVNSHEGGNFQGMVIDSGGNIEGDDPDFVDFSTDNFHLSENSQCINAGSELSPACIPDYEVNYQYVRHCMGELRNITGAIDIGAFEYKPVFVGEYGTDEPLNVLLIVDILKVGRVERGDVVSIYDIKGTLLKRKKVQVSGVIEFNLKTIGSGILNIVVERNEKKRFLKVIKTK